MSNLFVGQKQIEAILYGETIKRLNMVSLRNISRRHKSLPRVYPEKKEV